MRSLIAVLLLTVLSLPAPAEESKEHYSEAQFRSAAKALFDDPTAPEAKENNKTVLTWTVESPLVEIAIGPPILKLIEKRDEDLEMSLVCAFAAGQALAQRDHNVRGGFAEEGGKRVLEVYAKIQSVHPDYVNKAAEELKKAADEGRLEKLLQPPPRR